MLAATAGSAGAEDIGDHIAEALCHPPSVHALRLDRDADAAYRRAGRIAGSYRDIQGVEARAWFEKTPGGATCRTPADSALTLFFCAAVSHADGVLTKSRARLCS